MHNYLYYNNYYYCSVYVILLLCRITVDWTDVGGATGFHSNNPCACSARFPFASCKIPVEILHDSCKILACKIKVLHGCKACKKSCKPVLVRFLQVLVRLWPFLLQFARFLSKHTRFSGKMCKILLQAWHARFLQEPNVWVIWIVLSAIIIMGLLPSLRRLSKH